MRLRNTPHGPRYVAHLTAEEAKIIQDLRDENKPIYEPKPRPKRPQCAYYYDRELGFRCNGASQANSQWCYQHERMLKAGRSASQEVAAHGFPGTMILEQL